MRAALWWVATITATITSQLSPLRLALRSAAATSAAAAAAQPLLRSASEFDRRDLLRSDSMVDNNMTCAICMEVFLNAVQLPCSHVFDAACLQHLTAHTSSAACPLCRSHIPSPLPAVSDEIQRRVEAKYPQQVTSGIPCWLALLAPHTVTASSGGLPRAVCIG